MTDKKIYVYQSPFGLISIRPDADRPNRWYFVYEEFKRTASGELLSSKSMLDRTWQTPESAADAVRTQTTCWNFWDALPRVVFPASLDDWAQVDPYSITST